MNLNDTEDTLSGISKVNPHPLYKKIASKSTLVLLMLIGAGFLWQLWKPETPKVKPVIAEQHPAYQDELAKNLEAIQKLEQLRTVQPKPVHPLKRSATKPRVSKEMLARINAPTTLIHNSAARNNKRTTHDNPNIITGNGKDDIATVSAKQLAHPALTVPAGEMIPATLGVAMNSELPGMIMATTERPIYSLTGENILIPRGSRLVGQYNAAIVQGQSRFLIIWNRVQLPNGVVVNLQSPGADSLGRSGLEADSIDRHFFQRFGNAALLSMIGAFAANQGVDGNTAYNSASEYRSAVSASFHQSAQRSFERDSSIKPTLDAHQGASITVFVAKDLDFAGVGRQG